MELLLTKWHLRLQNCCYDNNAKQKLGKLSSLFLVNNGCSEEKSRKEWQLKNLLMWSMWLMNLKQSPYCWWCNSIIGIFQPMLIFFKFKKCLKNLEQLFFCTICNLREYLSTNACLKNNSIDDWWLSELLILVPNSYIIFMTCPYLVCNNLPF